MRTEREPNTRRYWVAIIFLLLGVLAGSWHNRRVDTEQQDYVVIGVRTVVDPPAGVLGKVTHWFGEKTGGFLHAGALTSENKQLRERVAALEGENATLRETQAGYEQMRSDLGFARQPDCVKVPADVIALRPDPKFDVLVISRGSSSGIKSNSVVLTRNGLVGRVFDVTPYSASVLMITDQKFGVGARIQRVSSRAVGVCEGDNSPSLAMLGLASDADVHINDVVVTSGLGGIYPKGLIIGDVAEVKSDGSSGGKTVRVRPRVRFDRIESVYVIP